MKPSTTRRGAGALLAGAFTAHLARPARAQGAPSSTLRLFVT
jgi:hypothetical protein